MLLMRFWLWQICVGIRVHLVRFANVSMHFMCCSKEHVIGLLVENVGLRLPISYGLFYWCFRLQLSARWTLSMMPTSRVCSVSVVKISPNFRSLH